MQKAYIILDNLSFLKHSFDNYAIAHKTCSIWILVTLQLITSKNEKKYWRMIYMHLFVNIARSFLRQLLSNYVNMSRLSQ